MILILLVFGDEEEYKKGQSFLWNPVKAHYERGGPNFEQFFTRIW